MVYVSLRTDKPGTVNSFTVMMKANSRPAPVLRLVPDRDSRNNSVRPTARLRAVSDFQFSIRDRPCRHLSRLSVSRWNRLFECSAPRIGRKYSINSLVYWVTYVHNVVYSFYRSMIYCYINSTQRCAGSIVIDIIPTNGADKRKFFPFAPYFPVTNVIKRYFYPYFPAIIGIKGYSFPYFPYLSGIMKIKTALYSLFSRLDWHKTVVFPCLGEIYEGIRSLSWEIPVT